MAATVSAASAEGQAVLVDIRHIDVAGNSLLSADQVQRALPRLPARMGFADIERTAQQLQDAYRAAGFGAVVVRLAEQRLDQGSLRLDVVEGRLSAVQVTGVSHFDRDNVLRSLPSLRLGSTPDLKALDAELLMANENPAKSARVVLQPGERPTAVEALVVVEEQDPQRWEISADNSGNATTGRNRLTFSYQNANVGNTDTVLGARVSVSPTELSKVFIAGLTLRAPLYAQRVFLEGSLLSSNTRDATNATPAGELRFSGRGTAIGARALWTLPSLGEVKSQASIGLEARSYRNDCSLGDFGAAGCGTAAASVDVLPLTVAYQARDLGRWSAYGQWVANTAAGRSGRVSDFEASRPGARPGYRLVRGGVQWQGGQGQRWSVRARVDSQWSNDLLVPAEQFGAGGASSVRGYRERELSGDAGLTGSVELRLPWSTLGGGARQPLEPTFAAFVDAGTVRNQALTACDAGRSRCSIWSSGLGLVLRPNDRSVVRLDAGRAGRATSSTESGAWRWHVSVVYTL